MGYFAHDVVIATVSDYVYSGHSDIGPPDVEGFRESLPEEFRALVVGPVRSTMNGYLNFVFLPDGSKEGWSHSAMADEYRERFIELFSERYEDGSSPFDVVAVRFGGDFGYESPATVTFDSGRASAR